MPEFLNNQWVIILLFIWTLPWKGVSLWKAARLSQKKWFVALLVLNTFGILEILYIFIFSKKGTRTETEEDNK